MSIYIGENIKSLRRKKDITQEQLSEILNVSNVAVSKWERGETYPDISLLPVLATYFGVTIDELMGYDISKTQEEVAEIEREYWQFRGKGLNRNASSLINNARQKYYDNYRIMNLYMYDIIGGKVAQNAILIDKKDELTRICDNILCGCTDEKIRLEAINIKAKILCAEGKKQQALDLLCVFPDFGGTAGIRAEQLFAYDSEDSRNWVRRNLYKLAEGFAVKQIKKIWFDDTQGMENKISYAEKLGDCYTAIYEESQETAVLVLSHKLWESLALRVIADYGNEDDIIRIKNKELQCAEMLDESARHDMVLSELISKVYNGKRILAWSLEFLESAPQKTYERMRNSLRFKEMLTMYKQANAS